MFKLSRRASSILEYAIVLGVVSMALTAMSTYMKRGIQGRTKDLTTGLIVENLYSSGSGTHQYVAGTTQSESTISHSSSVDQDTIAKVTTNTVDETVIRTADDYSVMQGWEDLLP